MSNIIPLPSRAAGTGRSPPKEYKEALERARELLSCTIDSIRNTDGNTDECHFTTIEKVQSLLCEAVRGAESAHDDAIDEQAMSALSLVELARFAFEAGPVAFNDSGGVLNYGLSIAEGLEAALCRLNGEEVANG